MRSAYISAEKTKKASGWAALCIILKRDSVKSGLRLYFLFFVLFASFGIGSVAQVNGISTALKVRLIYRALSRG